MTVLETKIKPAITPAEQRYLDLYARIAENLPGARIAQVRTWREAALDAFVLRGMPHRRIEEWKYTDLRVLMPEVHQLAGLTPAVNANVSVEAAIGKLLAHLDAWRAVFVDGHFRPDLSTVQDAPGLTFRPLRGCLEKEVTAKKALEQFPLRERDTIAALATAFATDGALLSVASGHKLAKPLHLIILAADSAPKLYATQNAISIGEDAEITLIETHAALGQAQAFSAARLTMAARAKVRHVRLNSGAAKQLSSALAVLSEGAQYDPLQMTVDGELTRAEANIRFEGHGARSHYTGAMLLSGHSHSDFTLKVDHAATGCESRELAKAVLDGRSRGVFQAKVIVERGAQKTDGKQMANALLLSDEAEFDSKPELEIFADDVVCGHGSTAGQLDGDMLFYLRARGIPEAEARALLIAAFVGEALNKVESEALREALQEKVDAWLSNGVTAAPRHSHHKGGL